MVGPSGAPSDGAPLPQTTTSFVGREAEVGAVRGLLARQRLVTVAGPGGCR